MEIAASARSISKRSDASRVRTASSQHAPSLCCIDLPAAVLGLRHQPDTILAVLAGHRGEFVKDPAPFLLGKRLASIPYCCPATPVSPFCLCFPPGDRLPIFR